MTCRRPPFSREVADRGPASVVNAHLPVRLILNRPMGLAGQKRGGALCPRSSNRSFFVEAKACSGGTKSTQQPGCGILDCCFSLMASCVVARRCFRPNRPQREGPIAEVPVGAPILVVEAVTLLNCFGGLPCSQDQTCLSRRQGFGVGPSGVERSCRPRRQCDARTHT